MKNFEKDMHHEKNGVKEQILANPAFIRFSSGFKLYQELLHSTDKDEERGEIMQRMRDLHTSRLANRLAKAGEDTQRTSDEQALLGLLNYALSEAEKNSFSEEVLAEQIATSPIANVFLTEWNRGAEEVEESGMTHVNEVIAYKQENDNEISLHIRPTGVDSSQVILKTIDGFKAISSMLDSGKLNADRVVMKSWMLNKKLEKKIRLFLGDDVSIEDTEPEDDDVLAAQHLALQYNKKSLEEYLKTGQRPEVRQMIMTKEEFIEKFKRI